MLCMSCSRINQDGAVHDGISVFTFDCMSLTSYEFDKWMNKLHVQVQCQYMLGDWPISGPDLAIGIN